MLGLVMSYYRDMTQTELEQAIAKLNAEIQAAISSTTTDGTTVSIDLRVKTQERDRLIAELELTKRRRPKSGTLRVW